MSIDIKPYNIDQVSDILSSLKPIMDAAYYNSKMYPDLLHDLERKPEIFKMFVAYNRVKPVGLAVVEKRQYPDMNYHDFPPIHIKRFTVGPEYRAHGLGRQLIEACKDFAQQDLGLDVLFGQSNEAGAMRFYGRNGALFSIDSIKQYSDRNSPEDNLRFFARFTHDEFFESYRYQTGQGISMVLPLTPEARRFFAGQNYVELEQIWQGYDAFPSS